MRARLIRTSEHSKATQQMRGLLSKNVYIWFTFFGDPQDTIYSKELSLYMDALFISISISPKTYIVSAECIFIFVFNIYYNIFQSIVLHYLQFK